MTSDNRSRLVDTPPDEASPASTYSRRSTAASARAARLELRSRHLSIARFLSFAGGIGCLFGALLAAGGRDPAWFASAGACFVLFAVLVPVHDRLLRRLRKARVLEAINRESLHRLSREFDRLPRPLSPGIDENRALVKDLHLFGAASLYHLVCTAATPPGRATLCRWLLEAAAPEEVGLRQEAVRELAKRVDLRQELQVQGRILGEADPDPEPFLRWAESEPWLGSRRGLLWAARALTALSLISFVAYVTRTLPIHIWLFVLLVNFAFSFWKGRPIQELFASIASREGSFSLYPTLFSHLESSDLRSPLAAASLSRLTADGRTASHETRRLHRLVGLSHLRYSSLHGTIQALILLDFHLLSRIERWQRRCGPSVRSWFESLGRLEALTSLAVLAHDHPEWAFPTIDPDLPSLDAVGLGHPTLAAGVRVDNDLRLGPAGTFLLLTGSNMSGKSTLLRAVGNNVVLAQAGGPVCAERLQLPPVDLGTSILIEDSLVDGVSFFMAELKRLKTIVERARARNRSRRLLFLLDEILRGTNTAERRIAVRKVLLQLIAADAIGAVSTHDLEIAEVEELAPASRPMHFRETLHDDEGGRKIMSFDYRLRPGVATTANALRLLRMVGLDDDA